MFEDIKKDAAERMQKSVAALGNAMAKIRAGLAAHNAQNPASSQSIKRFSLLTTPPSIGDGEITEKGYVNQGLVQRLRADDVALLFGENHPSVMDV